MGASLQVANQKDAYIMSDRGTFLASQNLSLVIVLEGDPALLNVYSVMEVNPDKFSLVNGPGGKAFADFMVSDKAQSIIKDFGVDKYGQPLFTADAGKTYEEVGSGDAVRIDCPAEDECGPDLERPARGHPHHPHRRQLHLVDNAALPADIGERSVDQPRAGHPRRRLPRLQGLPRAETSCSAS